MVVDYDKFGKYQEKWVAIDVKTEKILTSACDIASVQSNAEKVAQKNQKIVLKYIHRFDRRFAPSANIIIR